MEKPDQPPQQRRRTGHWQPAVIDSLVKLSARVAAPHLTPGDRDSLPEQVWPHLQRHMSKEKQKAVFRDYKLRGPGRHHLVKHHQYNEDGKYHGTNRDWRKDGTLETIKGFSDGKRHGTYETFGLNGKLTSRNHLKLGVFDGKAEIWYTTGQLISVDNYVMGVQQGESISYYEDGKWRERGFVKDGIRSGDWTWWFPTGQPKIVLSYDDAGQRQGRRLEWHANGELLSSMHFLDNKCHGTALSWNKHGTLEKCEVYERGALALPELDE